MESVTILNNVEDKHIEELETVTIRFAGDSGDGMQLTGTQFTNTTAIVGNDISTLPDEVKLPSKEIDRSKNFWALGLMYWLYDRPLDPTQRWIEAKFKRNPEVAKANQTALKAGFAYAEAAEIFTTHYRVRKAAIAP